MEIFGETILTAQTSCSMMTFLYDDNGATQKCVRVLIKKRRYPQSTNNYSMHQLQSTLSFVSENPLIRKLCNLKPPIFTTHFLTTAFPVLASPSSSQPHSALFLPHGSPNQEICMTTNNATQIGCSTQVPLTCAKSPVKKGAIAPPALPMALMTLNPLTWMPPARGRFLENTEVAHG